MGILLETVKKIPAITTTSNPDWLKSQFLSELDSALANLIDPRNRNVELHFISFLAGKQTDNHKILLALANLLECQVTTIRLNLILHQGIHQEMMTDVEITLKDFLNELGRALGAEVAIVL
ncbi:hypothetical protein [Shimazuella kribbensis]|uniref:hypothetical protein n=1 Tax=Shimazuella kribbensis TaxID=139808 RepID=UPI000415022D|nr:hypothetical protein [Shimazuella kribbensis]